MWQLTSNTVEISILITITERHTTGNRGLQLIEVKMTVMIGKQMVMGSR